MSRGAAACAVLYITDNLLAEAQQLITDKFLTDETFFEPINQHYYDKILKIISKNLLAPYSNRPDLIFPF